MELAKYLDIVRRRRGIILATVLVAALVSVVGLQLIPPTYVATSTLRLSLRSGANLDYSTLEYSVRLKNTFADIAVSDPAIAYIQQQIGPIRSADDLRQSISVQYPNNNELISVVVRDPDPATAAQIANDVSLFLINENQRSRSGRSFTVDLVAPAAVPQSADNATRIIVPVLGAIVSLVAGLGLALLLDNLDTTIRTRADVAAVAKLPLLGSVPRLRGAPAGQCYNGNSPEGEAFRQLRTNLTITNQQKPLRTIAITSAEPGEGKSVIAANLAYSLAQQGQKVLIVDGDLRMPTLHTFFNLPNWVGLADVLTKKAEISQAINYVADQKVHVMTSGTTPAANPADLLSSPALLTVIKDLTQQFDAVVIDTPALLAVADPAIISTLSDGVLLVVRCDKSRKENVQSALEQMVSADIKLVGVVANGTDMNRSYAYYQRG